MRGLGAFGGVLSHYEGYRCTPSPGTLVLKYAGIRAYGQSIPSKGFTVKVADPKDLRRSG